MLLCQRLHVLLLQRGNVVFQSDFLHAALGFEELGLLQVLRIGTHEVKSGSRVRIASISVNAIFLGLGANEFVVRLGADLVFHSIWIAPRVHSAQVDAILLFYVESFVH